MRPDPEPHDDVIIAHTESTVREADPDGVDRAIRVYELEAEARMGGVPQEYAVCGTCSPLTAGGQPPERQAKPQRRPGRH